MDFGLEGLVSGQSCLISHSSEHHHHHQLLLEGKPKSNGSESIKQERSDPFEEEATRVSKLTKRGDDLGLRSNDINLPKQQMLSFSSNTSKPEVSFLCGKDVGFISDRNNANNNLALSYFQQNNYSRNSLGVGPGNINGGMHGCFSGIRGPFTPAQWIELEHQAMIYKYLTANVPVPANLLIPIRKALSSSGFPGFSLASYPAHTYGWGSFPLGYSGSTDPEPGRCRRTDGKKWRCSRDAVPDQKYCERHINRGRHRSRKPVEGHTGQAASLGPTNTKVTPAMSASMPSLVSYSGSASNSIVIPPHQIKGLQPAGATNAASTNPIVNRLNDQQGLSMMHPSINLKSKDSPFSSSPKQLMLLDEPSQPEFGLVSTDSLLNPTQKSPYLDGKSYNSFLEFNTPQNQDQYPLKHFLNDWSKDESNRSSIPWPEGLKSDWTQLSMSSSGLSSNQDKIAFSPLRLTTELDPSQMGLGVGTIVNESPRTKPHTWIPIACGNPTGGPLGEVLNNANNVISNHKGEIWDGSSQLGASPTGVLQKSTFVSLSNSSSGGSPRRENNNKRQDSAASPCDDLLISAAHHATSSSIPSM